MDTVRSRFFWRGDPDKFKYHMMNWDNVYLPKEFGGLGITNTRFLNEALILKWAWRLQNWWRRTYVGSFSKQSIFQTNHSYKVQQAVDLSFGKGWSKSDGN
jgi:hypothetical protein